MSILRTKVSAKLRVYNKDNDMRMIPISAVTVTFALNEVPQCHVQIGLGTNVHDDKFGIPVDATALSFMEETNLCQVLAIFDGDFTEEDKWNDNAQVIFEGRINSVANQITRGAASLNLSIQHWLGDLQGASLLMSYAYAFDARKTSLAITYGGSGRSGGQGRFQPSAIGSLADATFFRSNNFQEDLWAKGIKELFAQLTTNDLVGVEDGYGCEEAVEKVKDKVKVAIQRIQGVTPSGKLASPPTKYTVPLTIADAQGNSYEDTLLNSIAASIAQHPTRAFEQSDVWSRLISFFVPHFKLALVPRVLDAVMVPYMPALRTPYCHRIVSDDIIQLDTLEPIRSVIRGFGIYSPIASRTGTIEAGLPGTSTFGTACFQPLNTFNNGKVQFGEAPAWLAGTVMAIGRTNGMLSKAQTKGGVTAPHQPHVRPPEETIKGAQGLLDQFAQYGYYEQRLLGKSLKIVGKVRFDIAPGSVVEVAATVDQFTGTGRKAPAFQGLVNRVTINIDANRQAAATIMQLSHTRTLAENEQDDFTAERHPLYLNTFHGCPIIDEYENSLCR